MDNIDKEWDDLHNTIMEIKKKREETVRLRNIRYSADVEDKLTKMMSDELAKKIDKSILDDLLNMSKFKHLKI